MLEWNKHAQRDLMTHTAFSQCRPSMTIPSDRRSRSLWMDIDVAPDARELEDNRSCDTVVIGSGIAGMSTAYELATEGQKVVVIDRGAIAGGITARTSAHLAPLCDDLTSAMIKLRGDDISRAFYVIRYLAGGQRHRGKGRPALRRYHRPHCRGTRWRSGRQD